MAVERSLALIWARDAAIRAWVEVDEAGARSQALAIDASDPPGPLAGLTLGVKDIIDVGGLRCECGSPIYAGRVAFSDAALVAELKALGAACLGKTATAEFAYLSPPPTRNPRGHERSAGGSSSGSAAAVADGHVDVALGTQTAGSILRPAAFCGTVGFKPTFGRTSRAGVLSVAPSLDTVGWLAKDVRTAARIWQALTREAPAAPSDQLGFCRTVHWLKAEAAMRLGLERLAKAFGAQEVRSLAGMLDDAHGAIMQHEMRQELATQLLQHPGWLSLSLRDYLGGAAIPRIAYQAALDARDRIDVDTLFEKTDILMTPAACGEAVAFGSTGDPCFNRLPTLLGLPSITIPFGTGERGLPLGLQLIARRDQDGRLLATAALFEDRLARTRVHQPSPAEGTPTDD